MNNRDFISDFPPELTQYIFSFLPEEELLALQAVSKDIRVQALKVIFSLSHAQAHCQLLDYWACTKTSVPISAEMILQSLEQSQYELDNCINGLVVIAVDHKIPIEEATISSVFRKVLQEKNIKYKFKNILTLVPLLNTEQVNELLPVLKANLHYRRVFAVISRLSINLSMTQIKVLFPNVKRMLNDMVNQRLASYFFTPQASNNFFNEYSMSQLSLMWTALLPVLNDEYKDRIVVQVEWFLHYLPAVEKDGFLRNLCELSPVIGYFNDEQLDKLITEISLCLQDESLLTRVLAANALGDIVRDRHKNIIAEIVSELMSAFEITWMRKDDSRLIQQLAVNAISKVAPFLEEQQLEDILFPIRALTRNDYLKFAAFGVLFKFFPNVISDMLLQLAKDLQDDSLDIMKQAIRDLYIVDSKIDKAQASEVIPALILLLSDDVLCFDALAMLLRVTPYINQYQLSEIISHLISNFMRWEGSYSTIAVLNLFGFSEDERQTKDILKLVFNALQSEFHLVRKEALWFMDKFFKQLVNEFDIRELFFAVNKRLDDDEDSVREAALDLMALLIPRLDDLEIDKLLSHAKVKLSKEVDSEKREGLLIFLAIVPRLSEKKIENNKEFFSTTFSRYPARTVYLNMTIMMKKLVMQQSPHLNVIWKILIDNLSLNNVSSLHAVTEKQWFNIDAVTALWTSLSESGELGKKVIETLKPSMNEPGVVRDLWAAVINITSNAEYRATFMEMFNAVAGLLPYTNTNNLKYYVSFFISKLLAHDSDDPRCVSIVNFLIINGYTDKQVNQQEYKFDCLQMLRDSLDRHGMFYSRNSNAVLSPKNIERFNRSMNPNKSTND